MTGAAPGIPAATVVVMRERSDGPPELLMVERAKGMTFAGGALVFPGGRVDPGDHALAALRDGDADDDAHRIAAIRETIEEVGIAIGLDPEPAELAGLRARLHAGEPFGALLHEAGAALAPEALVPFARWLPNFVEHAPRVFDTRFYLALAPEGAEPVADGGESVHSFWASARDVLAMADAGTARIIYPTRRNLERLALFASFADAVADARSHPVRTITPWVEKRADGDYLCIAGDLGYPVTSQPFASAMRG